MRSVLALLVVVLGGWLLSPADLKAQTTPANCWWVQSSQPGADYAELWCRRPDGRAFKTDQRRDQGRDDFTHGCPTGMKYDGMRCVPETAGVARPAAPQAVAPPAPEPRPVRRAVRGSLPGGDWRATGRVSNLSVRMDRVDDIALALVVPTNDGGASPSVVAAEWRSNTPGSAHGPLTGFGPGRNYVVVLIHNKAFPFGEGRWGLSVSLSADGRTVWSQSSEQRGGTVGIQYWTAFVVDRDRSGGLTVRPARAGDLADLQPLIDRIDQRLVTQAGTETSVLGGMAGALVEGLLYEGGRSVVRGVTR